MIVRDHSGSHTAALPFQVPPHQRVSANPGISPFCIPSSIAHRALPFECKQRDPHTPPFLTKTCVGRRGEECRSDRGRLEVEEVEEAGWGGGESKPGKCSSVRRKRMISKQSKVGTAPNYCFRAAAVELCLFIDAL